MVAVYIPLAYMVGSGFTVFVHKNQVTDLNLPFDQAMKSNLTAGFLRRKRSRIHNLGN
jgi:uncharacterized membrane protein